MKKRKQGGGYNERLFSGGLRARLHLARFRWIRRQIEKRRCVAQRVLELGCFDGKLIDFLPQKPLRYVGLDANWEGGLALAKVKWAQEPNYEFFEVSSPDQMHLCARDRFDIAVAMETLEHVSPPLVAEYLSRIAKLIDGYFFVTVPNEKGVVFLAKWLAKRMLRLSGEAYSPAEVFNATLGRMHLVPRHEHKGFDYEALIGQLEQHFEIVEVSGHPFGYLPSRYCLGIGIVAVAKRLT